MLTTDSLVMDPVDLSRNSAIRVMSGRAKMFPAGQGRIGRDELLKRTASAMARKLPTIMHCENDAREWAVIGCGPSIRDEVETIRKLKRRGVNIVSVNKSHDWLLDRGIVPWAHVLLDPKEWVADYVQRPRKDVRYFVASQCHDSVFEALSDSPVFLWHAGQDFPEFDVSEPDEFLKVHHSNSDWHVIPGPTTVGLRVPILGQHMSQPADVFHLFGMDSSRTAGKLHAMPKDEAKDAAQLKTIISYDCRLYHFDTNSHMSRQLRDFDGILEKLPDDFAASKLRKQFRTKFYGTGLLPFYAATVGLHANPEFNKDPAKCLGYEKVEQGSLLYPRISDVKACVATVIDRTGQKQVTIKDPDGDEITMWVPAITPADAQPTAQ